MKPVRLLVVRHKPDQPRAPLYNAGVNKNTLLLAEYFSYEASIIAGVPTKVGTAPRSTAVHSRLAYRTEQINTPPREHASFMKPLEKEQNIIAGGLNKFRPAPGNNKV
jgi:hypothetical protein